MSPEDIRLFLDETLDQLEVLEEEIVRLEGEGHDPRLLQDMFRIAHTVKGSSATVGHSRMSTLAHAMEDVFAAMRDGRLEPRRELVDVLLDAVDGLRGLAAELESESSGGPGAEERAGEVDIGPLMARLMEATSAEAGAYEVHVRFADDTVMPPVRALQVIQVLEGFGTVVDSRPSIEDIRAEKAGLDMCAIVAAASSIDEAMVEAKVYEVSDVDRVEVRRSQGSAQRKAAAGVGRVPGPAGAAVVPAGPTGSSGSADLADRADLAGAAGSGDPTGPDGPAALPGSGGPGTPIGAGGPAVVGRREPPGGGGGNGEATTEDVPKLLGRSKTETIRVGVDAFDRLVRIVSELAIDEARLTEVQRRLSALEAHSGHIEDLEQITAHMNRLTTELQEEVMKARMTPLASLFKRFPRMVRDTAASSGKLVEFVVEGEDTELDRALIEEVADPIIHLLRNAVGHGIEPPDERVRRGKPEKGRVRLAARHVEDRVVITVEDDGGGIDPARVRESAIRKGMIAPDDVGSLSDDEAIDLIFQPGFSTANQVDDVSGRGVGLDIVRTNVERLGGTIRVKTSVGKGTSFALSVPLTLAVFRALLVESCGQEFAVPLSSVVEVTRVPFSEVKPVGQGHAMVLRGKVLPVFDLRDFAARNGGAAEATDATEATQATGAARAGEDSPRAQLERSSGRSLVVVARYEDMRVGIIVGSLLGEQEIVIKSLGRLARCARGVLGGAILGDGRVALILDVARVLEKAMGRSHISGSGSEGGNGDRSDYQFQC
ncbi:MAG: chemotaxis protein CheW [Bacteroidota bacterium]